jgi:NAD(P)-dependent dehydrogenase (short-subunit alcohol dehydrogenase family)
MRAQRKGAIVNVASDWALMGARGALAYAVSKAALAQLSRCMVLDHAREGIRVNALCPGDTYTPMMDLAYPVRRRMIWNRRPNFGAEVWGSSSSGYAA